MRIIQRGSSSDLVVAYLLGPHIDEPMREALGPSPWIVAFTDAAGVSPTNVVIALGIDRVRSLVAVGYSAGTQAVRAALRSGSFPTCDRIGIVAIDGTHASIPPQPWQLRIWQLAAEQARKGEKLFVATCTAQTYVEQLPAEQRYLSTISVLRDAIDPALTPRMPPDERHDGDLHVYAYASRSCDAAAHIAQQREVLPMVLAKHVRPWLEIVADPETKPDGCRPRRSLGERALDVAATFVGWREAGPNKGDLVRRSLAGCTRIVSGREVPLGIREGVPWCAAFVGFCEHMVQFPGEPRYPWRAAVWELVRDAKDARTWHEVGAYVPRPGDLAVFKRGGKDPRNGVEGHVERVASVLSDGMFESIGGNVGDAVARRRWRIEEQSASEALVGWIVRGAT